MMELDFLELTRHQEQKIKSAIPDTRPPAYLDNSRYDTDLVGDSAFPLVGMTTLSVAADTFTLPSSQTSPATSFAVTDVICPSSQPPREADSNSTHVPYAHDEQYMPRPVQSPTPQRGYLQLYPSEQDIGTSTQKERNPDTITVSSQFSTKAFSAIPPFPVSQHDLTRSLYVPDSRNSQRPNSCSQPIKISSLTPNPELINSTSMARLVKARSSSPPPLRTVVPMSTESIQRYDRNYIMYGVLGHNSLPSHFADLWYTVLQNSHSPWSSP